MSRISGGTVTGPVPLCPGSDSHLGLGNGEDLRARARAVT